MEKNNIEHLEIERKYLVTYPDLAMLCGRYPCRKLSIVQYYLTKRDNQSGRIRETTEDGKITYYYTVKRDVTAVTRVEDERTISKEEFCALRSEALPDASAIVKTRYVIAANGLNYELDIYPFSQTKAILEVEISDETQVIPPLAGISYVREVTTEKEFSNKGISKKIPEEFLS